MYLLIRQVVDCVVYFVVMVTLLPLFEHENCYFVVYFVDKLAFIERSDVDISVILYDFILSKTTGSSYVIDAKAVPEVFK